MIKTTWVAPDGKEYSYGWGFPEDIDRRASGRTCSYKEWKLKKEAEEKNMTKDVIDIYMRNDVEITRLLADEYEKMKEKNMKEKNMKSVNMNIKNVIFNDPATIVFWADGTKTVVKCQEGDSFDPEKGLAMAIVKKVYGNTGSYCNKIKKWTDKYRVSKVFEKIDEIHEYANGLKKDEFVGNVIIQGIVDAMKNKYNKVYLDGKEV